jgi:hypothetical protein
MQRVRSPVVVELVNQLRLHGAGVISDQRLREAILSSRFFAQAPEQPGFLAVPGSTGAVIPVFTSERALARHAGAVRWFSTTGADLMSLAPVGHRFVIDPGSAHEVVVDPDVFAR